MDLYPKLCDTWIETYWKCIQQGFIEIRGERVPLIVGDEMRLQVEKSVRDLSNTRYIYDTRESDKRIKFKENCCFQSKKPFYMKPLQLMLHQKAFWELVYSMKMKDTGLRRYTEILELVARKNGKALSIDTLIPTPNGFVPIKDIHVGDYVYSKDGKQTKVINESEIFLNHKCYEITFEDGDKVIADEEHIWRVKTKTSKRTLNYSCKSNRKLLREDYRLNNGYFDLTTKDMIDDFKHIRKDGKGFEYKYRVPMSCATEYDRVQLPLSPYYLGVWLGDGVSENTNIVVGKEDIEETTELIKKEVTVRKIKEYENAYYLVCGDLIKKDGFKGYVNTVIQALKEIGVYKNKHIPNMYMQSSIEQRFELLKGLMDTDGYISKKGQCEFTQKNKVLAYQVRELLSSLGIKNTISKKIPTCRGKKCDEVYVVRFYTTKDKSCFKLKRKHERLKDKLNERMLDKSIIDIKEVDSVPTKCITVENESSLYLFGKNYTVTHNSTDLASDGNYDLFLGSGGEDIVCASNDDKQASLIWNEIGGMRSRLDPKKELTRQNLSEIRNDYKNITIFKMSEKTQNKDGRNIDKTYYDEMHDSKTDEIFMACWESMSIKDEPLLITCTTEGFLNDMVLDKKTEYARGVLHDEIDDEHFLPWLFTQDSEQEIFQDRWTWCKSNPSLIYGVKKWDFIEKNMVKAKHSKSSRVHMLCKDFNIKQNTAEAWLFESDYTYEQVQFSLEDFRGCYCFAGVDLSATTDLSCVTLLFMRPNDNKKYIYTKYFIPETKLDKDKNAGAKYEEWRNEGFVEVHEGNQIMINKIAEWFKWLYDTYKIYVFKLGYDLRFATDFLNTMETYGYGYKKKGDTCEMILQSKYAMSTPMKHMEADLHSQLIHGFNDMDRWCLSNVALEMDNREFIMPAKMKPEKRIDGAVSMIIAYAIFERYRTEYMNNYGGA